MYILSENSDLLFQLSAAYLLVSHSEITLNPIYHCQCNIGLIEVRIVRSIGLQISTKILPEYCKLHKKSARIFGSIFNTPHYLISIFIKKISDFILLFLFRLHARNLVIKVYLVNVC